MEYDSFISFVKNAVRPHKEANPEWLRLDGRISGGNMKPFGIFRYNSMAWRVNSDSHFEQLLKAEKAFIDGQSPFIQIENKLVLIPELRSKPKHLYIYQYGK